MLGAVCCQCGWHGSISALDFHHVTGKKHTLAKCMNKSWNLIKQEISKCVILCGICHRITTSNYGLCLRIVNNYENDKTMVSNSFFDDKKQLQEERLKGKRKSKETICPGCGNLNIYRNTLCPTCRGRLRRYRSKQKAVNYLGGKCNRCGWSGNSECFDFHHPNPDKEFTIGQRSNKSFENIKQELDKTELVCVRCHRKEHSNMENPRFLMAVMNYKGRRLD